MQVQNKYNPKTNIIWYFYLKDPSASRGREIPIGKDCGSRKEQNGAGGRGWGQSSSEHFLSILKAILWYIFLSIGHFLETNILFFPGRGSRCERRGGGVCHWGEGQGRGRAGGKFYSFTSYFFTSPPLQMAKKADAWKEYEEAALVDMMLKVKHDAYVFFWYNDYGGPLS